MTGLEHFRKSEKLLEQAWDLVGTAKANAIAEAQVHATLALTADRFELASAS